MNYFISHTNVRKSFSLSPISSRHRHRVHLCLHCPRIVWCALQIATFVLRDLTITVARSFWCCVFAFGALHFYDAVDWTTWINSSIPDEAFWARIQFILVSYTVVLFTLYICMYYENEIVKCVYHLASFFLWWIIGGISPQSPPPPGSTPMCKCKSLYYHHHNHYFHHHHHTTTTITFIVIVTTTSSFCSSSSPCLWEFGKCVHCSATVFTLNIQFGNFFC